MALGWSIDSSPVRSEPIASFSNRSLGEPALSALRHEDLGMVWTSVGHFPSCGQSLGYYLPIADIQERFKRSFIIDMTLWHLGDVGVILEVASSFQDPVEGSATNLIVCWELQICPMVDGFGALVQEFDLAGLGRYQVETTSGLVMRR